ncbi:MAG: glycosyltransferase family 2 protein [Dehalococcoidia bacterium]|nr:glycosyltransferase family 2 protein [Dehalococcoidia bacterium]
MADRKLTIVIPALNEELGIEKTVRAIPTAEIDKIGYRTQILVVDNGSDDRTAELAARSGAEVVPEPSRGYGTALKKGFAAADGDVIVTADADATYPLEDIPRLVQILDSANLEFITTNRFAFLQGAAMSNRNRIGNAILSWTMRLLFRLRIEDSQSGMWVFRREILQNLKLTSNTPLSQEIKIEACHFARCRWREVPILYHPRSGKAKLGGWKVGTGNLIHLVKKRLCR